MSPSKAAAMIAMMTLLALAPVTSIAQESETPATGSVPRVARVRCLDPAAARSLEDALAASPTIVRLVEQLQRTDLIISSRRRP